MTVQQIRISIKENKIRSFFQFLKLSIKCLFNSEITIRNSGGSTIEIQSFQNLQIIMTSILEQNREYEDLIDEVLDGEDKKYLEITYKAIKKKYEQEDV